MKNKDKNRYLRLPIRGGLGLAVYAVTLTVLIIFAQIVRVPFTHALVRLCLTMPILSVLCLFAAAPFVSAGARVGIATAVRLGRARICVNIKNGSFIPISTASVLCLVPDQNGERGATVLRKKLSLTPFSTVTVETEPIAYRRGGICVGVNEIWLYDLLHIIKIRKRINGVYTLAVLPMTTESGAELPSDGRTEEDALVTQDTFSSYDYGDVRDYRAGDAMKRIHWKLSSKSEELQVKRNVVLNDSHVCIVCDRSVGLSDYRLPSKIINELDDRTVEEAMSAVSTVCRNDGRGSLSIQTDDGGALLLDFNGIADEGAMRLLLSSVEKGEGGSTASVIPESATTVYYILTYLSQAQAKGVFDAHKRSASRVFNLCIRDVGAFIPEDKREEYKTSLDAFRTLLAENGISFFTVTDGGAGNEEK